MRPDGTHQLSPRIVPGGYLYELELRDDLARWALLLPFLVYIRSLQDLTSPPTTKNGPLLPQESTSDQQLLPQHLSANCPLSLVTCTLLLKNHDLTASRPRLQSSLHLPPFPVLVFRLAATATLRSGPSSR